MHQPAQHLILASASPRRAELLREHGYSIVIVEPPLPEPTNFSPEFSPDQVAEYLSHFKASAVAGIVGAGLIVGADTVAALDNRIFGKPTDRADAKRILSGLSGTCHQVITGVTLMDAATRSHVTRHDATAVHVQALSDAEIEAYLDTGAWAGKAGAYGIQDHGDEFVTRIEGSFTNVVGLPMELLADMLDDWRRSP